MFYELATGLIKVGLKQDSQQLHVSALCTLLQFHHARNASSKKNANESRWRLSTTSSFETIYLKLSDY